MGNVFNKLISVQSREDIPEKYRDTPIERLILYHNLNYPAYECSRAEMVILMCMDNRQMLRLPRNFSFMVRNSGGSLEGVSFSISAAIAVGKVQCIAVIGHSDCMMVHMEKRKDDFVKGLSENGSCSLPEAEEYFAGMCERFRKDDETSSILTDARALRDKFPGSVVAPLYYSLKDDLLYILDEQ